jgi:predicted DsbA family dithiol-disulfide isomerase
VGTTEAVRLPDKQSDDVPTVLTWYDFVCPFCYVGQHRTAILVRDGIHVVELPFQIHPEIPPGGIAVGPRHGPMYAVLEREAREAKLSLRWPARLPNTRRALAAAEWVRRNQPDAFRQFHQRLFEAHFALDENLEDAAVIDRHAGESGVDVAALRAGLADGSGAAAVADAETVGRAWGVQGTPAWLVGQRLISGLLPAPEFENVARYAVPPTP